jgi:hypothetical protein
MLVMALAPVIPLVELGMTPDTSDDVSVTAPVLPATLVTAAETVPEDTDNPVPTMTAPAVLVVAAGSRAAGTVPVPKSLAEPEVAIVASPETSDAAIVTAPVRPATVVTLADTVPAETLRPLPTITPPMVVVVADGIRAAGIVPVLKSDADPDVATLASPVMVLAACEPV